MTATRSRGARRGAILLETAISGLMLMIAMTIIVQVVASVAHARRNWDRRMTAANEAANQIERLSARPFDALAVGPVEGLSLSPEALTLPGAELKADVTADDPPDGPASKRITVQLRWRDAARAWNAPVRLTTWIHRRKEGS